MATQILAPTTAAAQSTPFVVLTERWVTVEQIGLAAAETAALQQTPDNGATWVNVLSAGVAVALTATLSALKVDSVGIFRLNKSATVGATSLYAATEDNQ